MVELKILPWFFRLEFEFHTSAIVLDELYEEQKETLFPYIEIGRLIVDEISDDDLHQILKIKTIKPNLSEQDCTALFQAQKLTASLITSDNLLRKFAKANHIEVHGHLWLFDNMVDNKILTCESALEKLDELCNSVNPKLGLPKSECIKRKKLWSQ